MGVAALVMAGGKGTRMTGSEEKPLLRVRGKPMIDYVLDALKNSAEIDRIIVAISKHTPKTARRARELSFEVFETPGLDFVSDMRYVIKDLRLGDVLVVSADLPLVSCEFIEDILRRYKQCGKPCLSVMTTGESYRKIRAKEDLGRSHQMPTGINVIDGERIDEPELEQENFITTAIDVAVNVNTLEDLQKAELLLDQVEEHRHR